MAVETVSKKDLRSIIANVHGFLKIPAKRYWVDFDEEADVLYISFRKPQRATDSEMRDDGVIVRKDGSEIVGLAILEASQR